jgi:glycosyltransferase involved in cell wall biosynthesis
VLRVLLVSGIWPPDVGGPASHGPEFGQFLLERGHRVRAVTSIGADEPPPTPFPLARTRRDRPLPVRLLTGTVAVTRGASAVDVVYATGLYSRSALASKLRSLPLVLKLVNDPAYERARSLGLFSGTLEEFQHAEGGKRILALKRLRDWTIAQATRIVIPSRYLAELAGGWGVASVRVVPNPAPPSNDIPDREALRRHFGLEGPTFVFAGRLARQKNVPLAIAALRGLPEASLVIIGDGPESAVVAAGVEREGLQDRVTLRGALSRAEAIRWMKAADAMVLPSDWENFPHAAVEALAVGTPVIATSVGGVPEIIESGTNGILVAPGDEQGLSQAMRSVAFDEGVLARLRAGAESSAGRYTPEAAFRAIEQELEAAVGAPTPEP